MEQNSANKNFSKVLILLNDKLNKEQNQFEKFKLLSTFNYVVRNNTVFKLCQQGNFEEAMSYLKNLSPRAPVPRYISILSKCGITVNESATNLVLIPKSKNNNNNKVLKIDNDKVGSGKDAVQVAAVQFASVKDGVPYLVDFNEQERRSKIEEHSEGTVKYDDYLNAVRGNISDREYREVAALNDEGEIDIKPEFDALIQGIHHPDTAFEIYEIFKPSGFGFKIKILKKKTLEFASPGFSVKNVENVYTFTPIVEMDYVKGPEDDELVKHIIDYLEHNSVIKPGDKIGRDDYDPKIAYKETCKLQSPSYTPDVAVRKKDDTEVQIKLLKGVSEVNKKKYIKVKFDFEEHRVNIQINKDKYLLLQDKNFKVPTNLRKQITGMKLGLKGLSFAEMVEQGTKIIEESTNTTAYLQSVLARSTESYARKERQVYMSLFLDMLIRSPAQFPKMYQGADGVYRFDSGFSESKVDKDSDPYELNKNRLKEELAKIKQLEQQEEKEVWPTLEERKREALAAPNWAEAREEWEDHGEEEEDRSYDEAYEV
jgi:hypothetical protein